MKWKKNEAQNSEVRIEKLADEVRSATYKSIDCFLIDPGQLLVHNNVSIYRKCERNPRLAL